jgi:hypothetical protein
MSLTKVSYSMIQGSPINVLDFGAVGNGITNDTTAIQNAINSAPSGSSVFFPSGTYLISEILITDKNIILYGNGTASKIKATSVNNCITINQTEDQSNSNRILNLSFESAISITSFILVQKSVSVIIAGCSFHDSTCTYAINHYSGYGLTVSECDFYDITGSGLFLGGSVNALDGYSYVTRVINCDFTRLSTRAVYSKGGFGILFSSCIFEQITNSALYFDNTTQIFAITFLNCWWEQNAADTIKIQSGTSGSITIISPFIGSNVPTATPYIDISDNTRLTIIGTNGSGNVTIKGSGTSYANIIGQDNYVRDGTFTFNEFGRTGFVSNLDSAVGNSIATLFLNGKTISDNTLGGVMVSTTDAGVSGKSGKVDITNTIGTGQFVLQCFNSSGTSVGGISTTSTATSFPTSSDYRLKHDIQSMTGALDKVTLLKPVTYKWNLDDSYSQGFIAHELQAVVPECVIGEKDAIDDEGNPEYQGIDTSFLIATLTAAVQELNAKFEEYKANHP